MNSLYTSHPSSKPGDWEHPLPTLCPLERCKSPHNPSERECELPKGFQELSGMWGQILHPGRTMSPVPPGLSCAQQRSPRLVTRSRRYTRTRRFQRPSVVLTCKNLNYLLNGGQREQSSRLSARIRSCLRFGRALPWSCPPHPGTSTPGMYSIKMRLQQECRNGHLNGHLERRVWALSFRHRFERARAARRCLCPGACPFTGASRVPREAPTQPVTDQQSHRNNTFADRK